MLQYRKKSIAPEQKLQADLGLDSLRLVTFLVMPEEGFRIVLDEVDRNPFDQLIEQSKGAETK